MLFDNWKALLGMNEDFAVHKFLSSESEQLVWKSEGLPADELSVENACAILKVPTSGS